MNSGNDFASRFFTQVVRWRWPILLLSLVLVAAAGSQLGRMQKNTQADAYISADNPALIYRIAVEERFNLKDPIVIAVVDDRQDGVYHSETLTLVRWLSTGLKTVANIDPDGITSLATESNIEGDAAGMAVEKFLDGTLSDAHVDWIREGIAHFPLYQGSLVARDSSTTLIVAELLDEHDAEATYQRVMALVQEAPAVAGVQLHVAGEGAVAGYLSSYIDQDARRLNPLAGLIITIILVVAFLTPRAALIPNLVVAGTVATTLGVMAWLGVEFYVITNGLIVCMIGIAVADSVHIFSEYYLSEPPASDNPVADHRARIVQTMVRMWRPVTLTTLTTAAGFLALYPSNDMPPLQYFGVFGALAVVVAWMLSLLVIPALLAVLRFRPSRRLQTPAARQSSSLLVRLLSLASLRRPRVTLLVGALVMLVAVVGTTRVVVNEERIENFQHHEPIYQADQMINQRMDGSHYLDVVIETDTPEGLYDPAVLRQIEALQRFLESQPGVAGSTSIVDYIKQMNKAVNEDDERYFRIPDDGNLIAQLFLLYSASADPTDFENRIDSPRQTALVRASLQTGSYLISRDLVPVVEPYLQSHFDGAVKANLSGRVNVDYHWIGGIAASHLSSVLISFLAVLTMAALLFRSLTAGFMAALPVGLAILVIYAVMAVKGIWLGVGTSMFAAIAIGLGVDFAIHTLDRLRQELSAQGGATVAERITVVFASTGRALWYNLLAVALGFGVLMTSQVPPLVNFGLLVALSVSIAFVASLVLLPALAVVLRPAFLFGQSGSLLKTAAWVALLVAIAGSIQLANAAGERPEVMTIIERMNAREDGETVRRDMVLTLTDRHGNERVEQTRSFRRYEGETKKTVIFYTEPASVGGTGFLTWDYPEADRDDDQWLYLPALRKVRRISASDRGDYFLGTDFTYEEIKKESKIEARDYDFSLRGEELVDGHHTWVVEAVPRTPDIAAELGYSRILLRIDSAIWMPRLWEFWDEAGNDLKTVHATRIEQVDGIWSVLDIQAENHKTGHITRMQFVDTDYHAEVPSRLFETHALTRGY
ncbi:outer membrane lipoprotein-sorting protein [Marinobacter mobilis]|uniref:outer membrane lipoprotein-sorting protein n=1 Tax=Marinobacter mobilis TaxID=488533 RepID=UPI0035C69241